MTGFRKPRTFSEDTSERQSEYYGEKAHPHGAGKKRQNPEQRRRSRRRKPFPAPEDLSRRDVPVLGQLHARVFRNHGSGDKGNHSRTGFHKACDRTACILILWAELLRRKVFIHILKAERLYRHIRTSEILPVDHVLVKDSLDFSGSHRRYGIFLVEDQYIALLDHRLAEQSRPFRKKETDYKQYDHARDETAGRKQPFHRFFQYSFHRTNILRQAGPAISGPA